MHAVCNNPASRLPPPLQPLTATLRKHLGGASPGAASPDKLARIVGHLEEPSSGEDGAGANPFDLGSSDDEAEEGGAVVDRWGWGRRGRGLSRTSCRAPMPMRPPLPAADLSAAAPAPPPVSPRPCRQYLKHRAHKLTNPKTKGHHGAGGGSPASQAAGRH